MISREEVQKQCAENVGRVKSRILALPSRLAGMLSHKDMSASEIEAMLKRIVNEVLIEIAREFWSEGSE